MNPTIVDNKLVQAGRYGSSIKADSSNNLPSRIEVMRAGTWPETSNKGMLYITPDDLQEFVENFQAGIGIPGGKDFGQIPIDFSHNDHEEAAGWITNLSVEGSTLFADVSWTTAGEAALKGGMFKCFSPSFWPACLGNYRDAELGVTDATNVLVGGALTNIPFFKDLSAIMADNRFKASNAGNGMDRNNKARKEITVQTLDEVRIKEVASLTADDKKLLADNKAELSELEVNKFKEAVPELAPAAPVAADNKPVNALNDEDAKLLASIKGGTMKVVNASEYDGMKSQVEASSKQLAEMREEKITASVTEHLKRGAIKADQVGEWTKRIIADASLEDMLKNLPDGKIMAAETGSSTKEGDATAEFESKVQAKITASNGTLGYSDAVMQVANEDQQLAASVEQQVKE